MSDMVSPSTSSAERGEWVGSMVCSQVFLDLTEGQRALFLEQMQTILRMAGSLGAAHCIIKLASHIDVLHWTWVAGRSRMLTNFLNTTLEQLCVSTEWDAALNDGVQEGVLVIIESFILGLPCLNSRRQLQLLEKLQRYNRIPVAADNRIECAKAFLSTTNSRQAAQATTSQSSEPQHWSVLQSMNASPEESQAVTLSGQSSELWSVLQSIAASPEEANFADEVFQRVGNVARSAFGGSVAWYGSAVNGFAMRSSDLDITVMLPDPEPGLLALSPVQACRTLSEALMSASHDLLFLCNPEVIESPPESPRIPLVRCVVGHGHHSAGHGLRVDISINNALALYNSRLLRAYSRFPSCAELGRLVKHWARQRSIVGAHLGFLSCYGYILMVIFFLQHKGLVPSLQLRPKAVDGEEVEEVHPDQYIDGIHDVWFHDEDHPTTGLEPMEEPPPLEDLMFDFFRFYAEEFNYHRYVVSTKLGAGGWLEKCDLLASLTADLQREQDEAKMQMIEEQAKGTNAVATIDTPPQAAEELQVEAILEGPTDTKQNSTSVDTNQAADASISAAIAASEESKAEPVKESSSSVSKYFWWSLLAVVAAMLGASGLPLAQQSAICLLVILSVVVFRYVERGRSRQALSEEAVPSKNVSLSKHQLDSGSAKDAGGGGGGNEQQVETLDAINRDDGGGDGSEVPPVHLSSDVFEEVTSDTASNLARPQKHQRSEPAQAMCSRLGQRWTCPLLHLPEAGPGIPRMSSRVNSLVIEDPFEKGHLLCSAPECQEKVCHELRRAVRILSDSSKGSGLKLLLQRSDEEDGERRGAQNHDQEKTSLKFSGQAGRWQTNPHWRSWYNPHGAHPALWQHQSRLATSKAYVQAPGVVQMPASHHQVMSAMQQRPATVTAPNWDTFDAPKDETQAPKDLPPLPRFLQNSNAAAPGSPSPVANSKKVEKDLKRLHRRGGRRRRNERGKNKQYSDSGSSASGSDYDGDQGDGGSFEDDNVHFENEATPFRAGSGSIGSGSSTDHLQDQGDASSSVRNPPVPRETSVIREVIKRRNGNGAKTWQGGWAGPSVPVAMAHSNWKNILMAFPGYEEILRQAAAHNAAIHNYMHHTAQQGAKFHKQHASGNQQGGSTSSSAQQQPKPHQWQQNQQPQQQREQKSSQPQQAPKAQAPEQQQQPPKQNQKQNNSSSHNSSWDWKKHQGKGGSGWWNDWSSSWGDWPEGGNSGAWGAEWGTGSNWASRKWVKKDKSENAE